MSERPLGSRQQAVLDAMADHRHRWHRNCGWVWDTESGTERTLESLVRRGLVAKRSERWDLRGRTVTRDVYRVVGAHPTAGGFYTHFKGADYSVISIAQPLPRDRILTARRQLQHAGVAVHSEDLKKVHLLLDDKHDMHHADAYSGALVLYRAAEKPTPGESRVTWARPLEEWFQHIERGNYRGPRFR